MALDCGIKVRCIVCHNVFMGIIATPEAPKLKLCKNCKSKSCVYFKDECLPSFCLECLSKSVIVVAREDKVIM